MGMEGSQVGKRQGASCLLQSRNARWDQLARSGLPSAYVEPFQEEDPPYRPICTLQGAYQTISCPGKAGTD